MPAKETKAPKQATKTPVRIFLKKNQAKGNTISVSNFQVAAQYLCAKSYVIDTTKSPDWKFENCELSFKGQVIVSHEDKPCNCKK